MSIFEAIIVVMSAISGAIIGAIIASHYLMKSVEKAAELSFKNGEQLIIRHEFIKAAAEFHIVFIEDLYFLRSKVADNDISLENKIYTRIDKRIIDHEKAMFRFMAYLPEIYHIGFTKAWKQYKYAGQDETIDKTKPVKTYWTEISESEQERRRCAIKYIKKLLHFTDPSYVLKKT